MLFEQGGKKVLSCSESRIANLFKAKHERPPKKNIFLFRTEPI